MQILSLETDQVLLILWPTVSRPLSLGIMHPSGAYDQIFITARQLRVTRVRVPWYSWPYFTVSDLRLLFSSPPTTRRVTVEVFEPASTWVSCFQMNSSSPLCTDRTENTVSNNAPIVEALTDPLLRNGLRRTVVLLLRALPRNVHCLQSHCLAMGLYAIIPFQSYCVTKFFPVCFTTSDIQLISDC
jgi:hypothetical protein